MSNTQGSFFDLYFKFVSENTESPITYHRWALLGAIGAILEKRYYLNHGHTKINPNLYLMLIGSAGTRKSSAIKLITELVVASGYTNIAADKTTKERFLEDFANINKSDDTMTSFLDQELTGTGEPVSILISADEFNDFAGTGNLEFYSLLGTLWDKKGNYKYTTKGEETIISDPVVSLLAGNTPTGFAKAFPPEIIGQGFFSRLLLIYGEATGKKIAFPEEPDPKLKKQIVSYLSAIRSNVIGNATLEPEAEKALEAIYVDYTGILDPRFDSYTNRRFNQLIKLCLIISASKLSTAINTEVVLEANTILTYAENYMPKALGEFGRAKNAEVTQSIMIALSEATSPLQPMDIWAFVSNDLNDIVELSDILRGLLEAKKIQRIPPCPQGRHKGGLLPKRRSIKQKEDIWVDYSLLTKEEQYVNY